jgi:Phage capsid family
MSTTTTDKFTVEFAADLTEAVDGVLHVARNRRDRWSREVSIGETARTLLRNWPDHREDIRTALRDVCLEYGLLGKVETTEIDGLIAGALKPTSVYSVTRIENSLVVVAHLSEGIPRHWLLDNTALEAFLSNELEYGLRQAVEAKVLADINGTSGTQAQAYATSVLATLRKGITKLETAGYTASAYILHPADSESVELALSSVAAVEHLSLPYDPATRRLFGVPVTTSNAQPAGVGHVIATDAVALDIDTRGVDVQWSENATADSFGKNLVFARCESRYATSIFSPLGVMSCDLTA